MSLINWLNDVIFTYCHRYTPTWVLRTVSYPEVYPGPGQISNMDLFAIKANGYKIMLPTIITKSSIVVVWRGTAYISDCKFTIPKLRLVSAIFYQSFILHQMIALQKLWKMLFHLKSSFRSRDIQFFVYSSSPLFFVSAIALEVDSRKILKFVMSSPVWIMTW